MEDFGATLVTCDFLQEECGTENTGNSSPEEEFQSGFTNPVAGTNDDSSNHTPAIEDHDDSSYTEGTSRTCVTAFPPCYSETSSHGGSCHCCSKSSARKLLVMWSILIILTLVVAFTLKLVVFASYSFIASPTDQRHLHKFSPTYFCSSLQITSTAEFHVNMFLVTPVVDEERRVQFQDTLHLRISSGNFQFWFFHLLRGSEVNLRFCGDQPWELLVFRDEKNFQTFQNGCLGDSCPHMYGQTISTDGCSETEKNSTSHAAVQIAETNDYYFVASARNSHQTIETTVALSLQRSTYSKSSVGDSLCENQSSCVVSGSAFPYGMLFSMPENSAYNSFNQVQCFPDTQTYLFVFLILPVMVGIVITATILLKRNASLDLGDTGTQTPPRSNLRSRPPQMCGPPTYEELFYEDESGSTSGLPDGRAVEPPPPYPGTSSTTAPVEQELRCT